MNSFYPVPLIVIILHLNCFVSPLFCLQALIQQLCQAICISFDKAMIWLEAQCPEPVVEAEGKTFIIDSLFFIIFTSLDGSN